MEDNRTIKGVIYPLSKGIAKNIFEKGRNIFVKYLTHEPTKKTDLKLKNGMKLYVYITKENKSIIGEAGIKEIYYMDLLEILTKFKRGLFLSEAELRDYAKGRETKKAQVLKLEDIKTYTKMIPVKKPITMAGMYITNDNEKKIFGR